ncbi:MAG: FMN-binding protein [Phycisphaerae bacterium]|nr:FMN-binding protein [Phycisphaerae bacterium]
MKKSKFYTLGFTVVLSCVCATVLTFANTQLQRRISANENFSRISALVMALGLGDGSLSHNQIVDIYNQSVTAKKISEMELYEGSRDGKVIGYALEVLGRGKYGMIKGILAVAPDSRKILSLLIYQQNETPGLGGLISSPEWLSQFADKPLVTNGTPGLVISSSEKGPNVIDGITGASKTTHSLVKIINETIAQYLSGGVEIQDLDLGLGVDAVTRATPGYPKNTNIPPNLREEVRRGSFMTPPGLENLALGKTVTSNMEEEPIIGEFDQITDGIKKSDEFDYVELDPGPYWVQVDLGQVYDVFAVVVWHYYKNPVIYNDVIVQICDNSEFTENVQTLFNNDFDNSAGQGIGEDTSYYARWWGEIADARGPDNEGTKARYVRVYTNGGAAEEETRFVEIAVYGK